MVVGQCSEQTERVLVTMSWIEDNNLVFPRLVVVLIQGKELVDTQIGKHRAYAIEEDIGTTILVFDGDMVENALMDILHELRRMGVAGQRVLCVL